MAKSAPAPQEAPAAQPLPDPQYPQIEGFIELSGSGDIENLFAPLRESLGGLKGPRADHGKKATKGVQRTEELLSHLLEVREKLRAAKQGAPKGRR
jgi:hypothetical protein